jgi:hypothetical protein
VKAGSRAHIVSSFTIIKGAMIDETYATFAAWDLEKSKRENLDRLRQDNTIGASSATWLRDVAKVLNRRFDPAGRDRALVILAQNRCELEEWKPILLWHMTRDEFLLGDFLKGWLFDAYKAGAFRVRPEELHPYLRDLGKHGAQTEHAWSDSTLARVAAGLLRMAAEFGLLRGSTVKEFAPYHLPERSFIYLLHVIRERDGDAAKVIAAPDWKMFRIQPSDVERELLHLHQFRKVEYHVAGTLVQLRLPDETAFAYAARMVA